MKSYLLKLMMGSPLTRVEAREAMDLMMRGQATPSQIASFLTSLRLKGESVDELIGFAESLRSHAANIEVSSLQAVDTCGTGGDGGKTFNISTAAAFVIAAAGIPVAKHGSVAVSGKTGSAEVLQALGMDIQLNPKEAEYMLEKTGLSFLFAPLYHQAMKHVMPIRKELGFRTCFNLLGPLANPAKVKIQLMGVYDPTLVEPVAEVFRALGVKRALVVSSLDGLDEITVTDTTRICEVNGDLIYTYEVTPEELGVKRSYIHEIAGGDSQFNAALMKRIFNGERGAPRDVVLLNAGAVLYLTGQANSIQEGVKQATHLIDAGHVASKLEEVVRYSKEVQHVS
ncbi:anthranilate phosphoribosyltransferase [Hazenella coriacea]|uniref:Anthranilate phosphoribosyltransferase n=1 Tax=Hazenella coriacea TaxID=1179467 RepID=A0A4R3L3A4_9BACL|nr:anthranilate phosphoribosyltransferase [Hazenella coriacea]TCS93388.1 anthranilate phosphoribosyltransferase [Hazenella coriacea]